ncbi:MAG: hypothetical protein U1F46_17540 [Marinagarivorans sp.]
MLHRKFIKRFTAHPRLINSRCYRLNWGRACVLATAAFSCSLAQAAAGRANYDVDGDGLIEIQSVEDFVSIKNTFGSAKLYGENTGCPSGGCTGYELMADLDFSFVGNSMTSHSPISLYGVIFEGNGHSLKNIRELTTVTDYMGTFSALTNSVVRNLIIDNININNTSGLYTGALAGQVLDSKLINVRASGTVGGNHYTGGLVGTINGTTILGCHFSGVIKPVSVGAGLQKGGLVGSSQRSIIYASSSEGRFDLATTPNPNYDLGGLIGVAWGNEIVVASSARFANKNVSALGNFAVDARLYIENSYVVYEDADANKKTAAVIRFYSRGDQQPKQQSFINNLSPSELKCPTSTWDERCSVPALLDGWDRYEDSIGQKVWDFGKSGEYPKIRADLIFDLADSDNDGIVDLVDHFPKQAAAAIDVDRDNKADFFAADCDSSCQQKSALQLDDRLDYTPPTSGPSKPVAGAVSLEFLAVLFLGLRGLRKRAMPNAKNRVGT